MHFWGNPIYGNLHRMGPPSYVCWFRNPMNTSSLMCVISSINPRIQPQRLAEPLRGEANESGALAKRGGFPARRGWEPSV